MVVTNLITNAAVAVDTVFGAHGTLLGDCPGNGDAGAGASNGGLAGIFVARDDSLAFSEGEGGFAMDMEAIGEVAAAAVAASVLRGVPVVCTAATTNVACPSADGVLKKSSSPWHGGSQSQRLGVRTADTPNLPQVPSPVAEASGAPATVSVTPEDAAEGASCLAPAAASPARGTIGEAYSIRAAETVATHQADVEKLHAVRASLQQLRTSLHDPQMLGHSEGIFPSKVEGGSKWSCPQCSRWNLVTNKECSEFGCDGRRPQGPPDLSVLQKVADGLESKLAELESSVQQELQLPLIGSDAPFTQDSKSWVEEPSPRGMGQHCEMEPLRREWRKARDTCDQLGRRLEREKDLSLRLENERLRLENVTLPVSGDAPKQSAQLQQQLQRELTRTTRGLGVVMQQYRQQWATLQKQVDTLEQHSRHCGGPTSQSPTDSTEKGIGGSVIGRSIGRQHSASRSLTPTPHVATPACVSAPYSTAQPPRVAATALQSSKSSLRMGQRQRDQAGRQPHMPANTSWTGTRTPRREAPATVVEHSQMRISPRQWPQQFIEVAPGGRQPKMPSSECPSTISSRSGMPRARTVSPRKRTPQGDEADELLCSLLQRFPEYPHWILLKERPGVYRMGNSNGRTIVKVSHAGLQVRIGGGWMDAQAFLERYGPQEMAAASCAAAVGAIESGEGSIKAPAGPSMSMQRSNTPNTGGTGSCGGSQMTRSLVSMERLLAPTQSWARRIGLDTPSDVRTRARRRGAYSKQVPSAAASEPSDVFEGRCAQNSTAERKSQTIEPEASPHPETGTAAPPVPAPMLSSPPPLESPPASPGSGGAFSSASGGVRIGSRSEPWKAIPGGISVVRSFASNPRTATRQTVAEGMYGSSKSIRREVILEGHSGVPVGAIEPSTPTSLSTFGANSHFSQTFPPPTASWCTQSAVLSPRRISSSGVYPEFQQTTGIAMSTGASGVMTVLSPRRHSAAALSPVSTASALIATTGTSSVASVLPPRRQSWSPSVGTLLGLSVPVVATGEPQFLLRSMGSLPLAAMPIGGLPVMRGASSLSTLPCA